MSCCSCRQQVARATTHSSVSDGHPLTVRLCNPRSAVAKEEIATCMCSALAVPADRPRLMDTGGAGAGCAEGTPSAACRSSSNLRTSSTASKSLRAVALTTKLLKSASDTDPQLFRSNVRRVRMHLWPLNSPGCGCRPRITALMSPSENPRATGLARNPIVSKFAKRGGANAETMSACLAHRLASIRKVVSKGQAALTTFKLVSHGDTCWRLSGSADASSQTPRAIESSRRLAHSDTA
mmetsp:Transcript_25809/g.62401  ORF Transcript_25809/g.62401 Transcript_25809/m.62401 type:complete len:238 (-) Transcript_25809:102-815(-)